MPCLHSSHTTSTWNLHSTSSSSLSNLSIIAQYLKTPVPENFCLSWSHIVSYRSSFW
jgi:hypothetical protein